MGEPPLHQEPDWLPGCLGFLVEARAGRIGRLEEVQRDPESGRPVALVVGAGKIARRRLLIPVEGVAAVVPSSGRIVLRDCWDEIESSA